MERDKIKLTNPQWRALVQENYLEIDGVEIDIIEIQNNYDDSGRHTEYHHMIFKRESDAKYFRINYEISVKDEMGWTECNYGTTEATQVFPEVVEIINYV